MAASLKPKTIEELLSPQGYLGDLLEFFQDHITVKVGATDVQVDTGLLKERFFQEFGRLIDRAALVANEPIGRLRVPVEVLRSYLREKAPAPLLVGHWRCDDEDGTTLRDSGPNKIDGTLSAGAVWGPGRLRGAVMFDGTAAASVTIPHASPRMKLGDNGADFSVAFWLLLQESHTGQWRSIIHKGSDDSSPQTRERTPALWMMPDEDRIYFRISTDAPIAQGFPDPRDQGGASVTEIRLNVWTHITYVKVGSRLQLYVDGRLDAQVDLIGRTLGNEGPIHVGHSPFPPGGIKGGIDDLRIYAFALSESTIRRLTDGRADGARSASDAVGGRYLQAAYGALLTQMGTSYDELRTARRAADEERKALAQRLGLPLVAADGKNTLAELVPPNGGPTESWLEQVFGLSDTTQPDPFRVRTEALVLQWQREALRQRWKDEDHSGNGDGDATPILDPDLTGEQDLLHLQPTDPLYALLVERRVWVEEQEKAIRDELGSRPSRETFAATLRTVLGPDVDLVAIADAARDGQPIEQRLKDAHLTSVAFRRLLYARELAELGELADPTRQDAAQIVDDVVQILTEARKEQQFTSWRAKEKDESITLSPDSFKLADDEEAFPPWRGSRLAHLLWQAKLQDRQLDWERLGTNLRTSVVMAEELALSLLRNALVTSLADEQMLPQVADRLSGLLFVDLNHSGLGQTTRVMEAIETVQGITNAIRSGGIPSDHQAAGWEIARNHPGGAEAFGEEWTAMGSHASWQAALSVFLYPENALLPALRPRLVSTFFDLVKDARGEKPKLTPDQAVSLYDKHAGGLGQDERAFDAPVFLALELQKAGFYVAALEWLRKIYDYSKPLDERKVWSHLGSEVNQAPVLRQDDHWMRNLNPHVVAQDRRPWNAYTRYILITIVRCLLDYADSEFAADTSEGVAHARLLYLQTQDLMSLPDLDTIPPAESRQVLLPNAVIDGLRMRTKAQLAKIRSGRNAAGLRRQLELLVVPTREGAAVAASGPAAPVQVRPTPYRYATLVERSKQLVAIAQQVEASYLAALEKQDVEEEKLASEGVAIDVGEATVALQRQRVRQAQSSTDLVRKQRARSDVAKQTYDKWIADGPNEYENQQIVGLWRAQKYSRAVAAAQAYSSTLQFASGAFGNPVLLLSGAAAGTSAAFATAQGIQAVSQILAGEEQTLAQVAAIKAGQERRLDEWRLQSTLAEQDIKFGDQQIQVARDEEEIRSQELSVAEIQKQSAEHMRNFLLGKVSSAEMYAWMAGILSGIYAYFLQQAASTAQLAQSQLSFERQEAPPSFIQSDYWRSPPEAANPSGDSGGKDRRGFTGSARLLEDIYRLDQYAFETDKRRLNLAQTFSLARLVPFEFELFKETGTLPFATPMALFDQGFPGHYLRLVKRVRSTLVALVPPNQGIRATLLASGISRVVVGPDVFRSIPLRRDPEHVALTSPVVSTGVFELDAQPELLLPFEGMGVDTQWEFVLPKAANSFDYRTIADLLVTIEYTALHSYDYQQQVVRTLDRTISADRIWSVRDNLADEWYDLNNPDQAHHAWEVHFETTRPDFPANLMNPVILGEVLTYIVAKEDGAPAEGELALAYAYRRDNDDVKVGPLLAKLQAGIVSTRRTDGNTAWGTELRGKPATGRWTLQIRDTADLRKRLQAGEIEDIIIILTFSGQRPPWPE